MGKYWLVEANQGLVRRDWALMTLATERAGNDSAEDSASEMGLEGQGQRGHQWGVCGRRGIQEGQRRGREREGLQPEKDNKGGRQPRE